MPCSYIELLRTTLVHDQQLQVFVAGLADRMGAAGAGGHGVAGMHFMGLAVQGVDAAASEHVIDLVLVVLVQAGACNTMQHPPDADGLHFGLAAACLKHSLPGDFNLLGIAEVEAFLGGNGFDVRR